MYICIQDHFSAVYILLTIFSPQRDVQERELSLIREYESKLLAREEENTTHDLSTSSALSASLARLSHVLRQFLRSLGGEGQEQERSSDEDREQWRDTVEAQHALERECELARLEKENEELRLMLDMIGYDGKGSTESRPGLAPVPRISAYRPSSQGIVRPFNIGLNS
jgi:hypothetical protein